MLIMESVQRHLCLEVPRSKDEVSENQVSFCAATRRLVCKEAKPKLSADARKGGGAAQNSILTLRTDAEVVMDPESMGGMVTLRPVA